MADYNIDMDKIKGATIAPAWISQAPWYKDPGTATAGATIANPEEIANDAVEHPSHYTEHPSGIECIEITRHFNFPIGNAIKYLWRAGLKDGGPDKQIEDLKKAVWYITDEIKTLEARRDGQ